MAKLSVERLALIREWVRPSDGSRLKLCRNDIALELLDALDAAEARLAALQVVVDKARAAVANRAFVSDLAITLRHLDALEKL